MERIQLFVKSLSSPSASLCSMSPHHFLGGRCEAWGYGDSMFCLRNIHPFFRLPTTSIDRRCKQDGSFFSTVALAAAPVRWSLDDVERISRGLPSKAKMGSRAVPHRLNAEERKAFELAKRRGYVVQKTNNRRYPLINSYRNYCDALGLPCVRIELGTTGLTDEVVIDFTPLHLLADDLSILRAEITKAITLVTNMESCQTTSGEVPDVDGEVAHTEDVSPPVETKEESGLSPRPLEPVEETSFLESTSEPLRFRAASRNLTKALELGRETLCTEDIAFGDSLRTALETGFRKGKRISGHRPPFYNPEKRMELKIIRREFDNSSWVGKKSTRMLRLS